MSDIVPDEFDLEQAKSELTKTRYDEARRHHNCGTAALEYRSGGIQHDRQGEDWYCAKCNCVVSADEIYHGLPEDAHGRK
jgi:hypothetical protein